MPHQPQISLALAYLTLATNRLLADDEDTASARLFAGVECLEFCSQLCELDTASDDAVAEVSVAEALVLAADALHGPGTGWMDVTRVLGGIADLLSAPGATTDRLRQPTGEALATTLQWALARSASSTIRNVGQSEATHDPQLTGLGGFDARVVRT